MLEALFQQAINQQNSGLLDNACRLYGEILTQQPRHAASLMNLGVIFFTKQQYQNAIDCFSALLEVDPTCADAYYNRGCAHHQFDNLKEAETDYRACTKRSPGHTASLENLITLASLNPARHKDLQKLIKQRLKIGRDVDALLIAGHASNSAGMFDAADRYFKQVLKLSPLDPAANYYQAAYATRSRSPSVDQFVSRWSVKDFHLKNPASGIPLPLWDGTDFNNKKVYVTSEQGLGDQVMFLSALDNLNASHVTLEVDPRLVNIVKRSFPKMDVIPSDADTTRVQQIDWRKLDYCIPASQLPELHRSSSTSGPWLAPNKVLSDYWREWLSDWPGTRIGISWRGGVDSDAAHKSVTLESLLPILNRENISVVSVQYDPDLNEIESINQKLSSPILVPPDLDCRNDMDGLLALLSELDLVITIDNATVHLSSAVGTPTWVALPPGHDWRWLVTGDPRWRQDCSVFQHQHNWSKTVQAMTNTLQDFAPSPRSRKLNQFNSVPSTYESKSGGSVLLVNDSLNWQHFGHSLSGQAIYQSLSDKVIRRIPTHSLAMMQNHIPAVTQFHQPEEWNLFRQQNVHIGQLIESSDSVVVNGEATTNPLLLLYIAFCAAYFEGKPTEWINCAALFDPAEDMSALKNIYAAFSRIRCHSELSQACLQDLGVESELTPLTMIKLTPTNTQRGQHTIITSSHQTTTQYLNEIVDIVSSLPDDQQVRLLTGGRTAIGIEDIESMKYLQTKIPGRITPRWTSSEHAWIDQISTAAQVISGQAHCVNLAHRFGKDLVIPQNTPTAAQSQCQTAITYRPD